MFEQFTDTARRAVVLAREEAHILRHNHIGTEHLLLGLIHEPDGLARQILTASGVSLDSTRDAVIRLVGTGADAAEPDGPAPHLPFTPRAKAVLDLALTEALRLRHDRVGTEHLLLAIVNHGEGAAAQVLDQSIGLNTLHQALLEQLEP